MLIKTRLDPNISNDENILRQQRSHPLLSKHLPLLGCGLVTVMAITLAVMVFSFLISGESVFAQVGVIGAIIIAGGCLAALTWVRWATTWHILTDNQLIISEFSLRKLGPVGTAIPISKIHEARPSQNILENWLNTGDLQIYTAANTTPTVFSNVTNLMDFRSDINEQLHTTQQEPEMESVELLGDVMNRLIKALADHTEALDANTAALLKAAQKPPTEGVTFQQ